MSETAQTTAVREAYRANFGPEQALLKLTGSEREDLPSELELLLWYPDAHSDLSTIATVGMSTLAMVDGTRAELHMAWMGRVDEGTEKSLVEFLANLAVSPFLTQQQWNWWTVLGLDGAVPGFGKKNGVLLHPPFHEEGWAMLESPAGKVKIFNVVPIFEDERLLLENHGPQALIERWNKERRDPFALG
jgi:hypothetical protein